MMAIKNMSKKADDFRDEKRREILKQKLREKADD